MPKQPDATLIFASGFYSESSPRDAQTSSVYGVARRWMDGDRVRFFNGAPEKMGGWTRQSLGGVNNGVYIGTGRALIDWSSLDEQEWIAIGTNCKLYLINNQQLYDITPLRKSSNTTGAFTTLNGSAIVTVSDVDHRANEGDHIKVFSTAAVGGLTLNGDYDVLQVIDPNTFTITAASTATSSASGGGSVTIEYDISCGLADNGELLGYGTGAYGQDTYGTPRTAGTGIPARLRTWSLDNWGEDLIASYNTGEIYWWDRTSGPNSRAVLIANAPRSVQRTLVNPDTRYLIALGAAGADGLPDRMNVRWCSEEDFNDWVPTEENTAGGQRLNFGSYIVTGIASRTQNLIWTDTQLYGLRYVGPSLIFAPTPLGKCSIVGPNAATDVNGIAYFMAFDNFFIYDGTLSIIPCDVWQHVFKDFNRRQAAQVFCSGYSPKGEVRWDYPSANAADNDRYVVYNYVEKCWYYGTATRTAFHDVSEAMTGYMTNPYGINGGYLYKHEDGTDEVEGNTTTGQEWFLQSLDVSIGASTQQYIVNTMTPDFQDKNYLAVGMELVLKGKDRPRDPYITYGPYKCLPSHNQVDVRASGSQLALRLQALHDGNGDVVLGQAFRMGYWQANSTPYKNR